jgi:hypothetical protein
MIKNFIFIILVLLTTNYLSQNVAINATGAAPAASAMLDITSTTSGLLIPRMTTAQRTAIAAPATGLKVYDTTTGTFWYYDGIVWVEILNGNIGWRITGNSLTTAGIFGSTNAQDVRFFSNNIERMRLVSGGVFGIGTTVPATSGAGLTAITKFKVEDAAAVAGNGLVEVLNSGTNGISMIVEQSGTTFNTNNLVGEIRNTSGLTGLSAIYGLVQPNTSIFQIAVRGAGNSSANYGVNGSVPTTGAWTGYGGFFSGGLGYANGLYNLSDKRVKKDFRSIKNALALIMTLNGVVYKYNTDVLVSAKGDDKDYFGFIAQDVEKITPNIVATKMIPLGFEGPSTIDNSNEKNQKFISDGKVVDYVQLVPVLVEAIKEQQKQIEALKIELELLKKRN